MTAAKRMRVFAGPNGSGKTTLIKNLQAEIPFGVYVNADDIESLLTESKVLLFNAYQIVVTQAQVQDFFKTSQFSPVKRNDSNLWSKLSVVNNVLNIDTSIDSYLAADIAEFIRQQLLDNSISFTYETVMSHKSKLTFLKKAQEEGFKVYLYFVATEDPDINISRVNVRVAQYGHGVAPEVVRRRYFKSLQHLRDAVKLSNRAYLWDNSSATSLLIAEVANGEDVKIFDTDKVPNWFVKYLIDNESA